MSAARCVVQYMLFDVNIIVRDIYRNSIHGFYPHSSDDREQLVLCCEWSIRVLERRMFASTNKTVCILKTSWNKIAYWLRPSHLLDVYKN